MSESVRSMKSASVKFPTTARGVSTLRRQCACGQHTPGGRTCHACANKQNAAASTSLAPPVVHDILSRPGEALDAATRVFMEPRFGRDFSGVRVHAGSSQAETAARAVDARAFTVGQSIVFGAGQYASTTPAGRELLAHELAHTLQQRGSALGQASINIGAADDAAEREAAGFARMAMRMDRADAAPPNVITNDRPNLRRQSTSEPKKEPKCRLKVGDYCVDVKPGPFPGLPIQPPSTRDVEKGLAVAEGDKSGVPGEANCSGFIGYSPGTGAYRGQCCDKQKTPSDNTCCPPDRFSVKDNRCCHTDEVLHGTACVKSRDQGVQPEPLVPPEFKLPPAEKPPMQDLPGSTLPPGQAYA